jgi:DNA repair exonuclease SbcCD nuclease subunit
MRILHLADCHFCNKPDVLEEVIRTTNAIASHAEADPPDIIVLAGDTLDEHLGRIQLDSDAARAAIAFVTRLANLAPTVIVRGTRSHDRESPYLFGHLRARHPIYVSTQFGLIALVESVCEGPMFTDLEQALNWPDPLDIKAAFCLLPSPDKSHIISVFGGDSVGTSTISAKEALHDALAYMGDVINRVPALTPRICVGHGMITGSEFSSGQTATGEDFEFSLSDLALTSTDLKLFGHIHKQQGFPGNVHYSGSPGRLNMGEREEKGFLVHEIHDRKVTTTFFQTPARYFVFGEYHWLAGFHGDETKAGKEGFELAVEEALAEVREHPGCDARFRLTVPEEERHIPPSRAELEEMFIQAGARSAKIECPVVPCFRQRAAGISRKETLRDKIIMYGETTKTEIPARTLDLAGIIERMETDELMALAKRAAGEEEPCATTMAAAAV